MIQGKMRAAALAGLAMGAASAAPIIGALNCACCSLVLLGGVLASHLYFKNLPPPPPETPMGQPSPQPQWGDAAVVGLLAGLMGAAVQAVLSVPIMFLGFGMDSWSTIQDALSGADVPPEIRNLFATFGSGTFAIGAILLTFVLNLFVYGLFSTLGALIGAAVMQRQQPPTMAPPPPLPPTPPPPPPPGAY